MSMAKVTIYLEIFQMTLFYACKQCKRGFRHYLKSMGWGSLISSHIGSVRYTKEARLVSTTQQYRCVHCDPKEIFKEYSKFIIGFQIFLTLVECLASDFLKKNPWFFPKVSCCASLTNYRRNHSTQNWRYSDPKARNGQKKRKSSTNFVKEFAKKFVNLLLVYIP